MSKAHPEIERKGTQIVFHHLHVAGGSGRRKVRATVAPRFAQANAPGGLRQISDYAAWELGAIAAMEDERLFEAGS